MHTQLFTRTKFIFKCHDNFNDIQTIKTEVVHKVSFRCHLHKQLSCSQYNLTASTMIIPYLGRFCQTSLRHRSHDPEVYQESWHCHQHSSCWVALLLSSTPTSIVGGVWKIQPAKVVLSGVSVRWKQYTSPWLQKGELV